MEGAKLLSLPTLNLVLYNRELCFFFSRVPHQFYYNFSGLPYFPNGVPTSQMAILHSSNFTLFRCWWVGGWNILGLDLALSTFLSFRTIFIKNPKPGKKRKKYFKNGENRLKLPQIKTEKADNKSSLSPLCQRWRWITQKHRD